MALAMNSYEGEEHRNHQADVRVGQNYRGNFKPNIKKTELIISRIFFQSSMSAESLLIYKILLCALLM